MGKRRALGLRIVAVENIQRITRTLSTVAAAKLSRTRWRAVGMREYAARCRAMLGHQRDRLRAVAAVDPALAALAATRTPVRRVLLLVITADRGMCGGYNLEACRRARRFAEERRTEGVEVTLVLKGRKGARYFARQPWPVVHAEGWSREGVSAFEVTGLLERLAAPFRDGSCDAVHVVASEFYSPVHREPRVVQLLPVTLDEADGEPVRWDFEPSFASMAGALVTTCLEAQLHALLLESYASEQGARMITMEEGTERAGRMLQEYRVRHNRLRREAITTDLLGALFASRAAAGERHQTARASEGALS